ncbi:MAG: hypothetical protein DYH13_03275 [Alphaproteobacteria bacterium PRO2]|nr:hypothetical protein [Alphaproteobacteria bacterium PRO2]
MTEQNKPVVRATYRPTTHSIGVRVNYQQVADIPVAHLTAIGAIKDGSDLNEIRGAASTLRHGFKAAYKDIDAAAIAQEYSGLTTISYDDYNKEGGRNARHTFEDPFSGVSLKDTFARFNERAIARVLPQQKESRPALPQTQIDPVVTGVLTAHLR